ncbi:hypothetical protein [Nonomuraea sp. NPDC050310]|uniref:hypothetical protein n=1 Tax=Nonomuraea sp. NPDC050310 TaxID=3154935 RepID=UPI0033DCF770
MSSHRDHVARLCEEGRFPWAHSYVDRLAADRPGDPEPWELRSMIFAAQGRGEDSAAALARSAELGGTPAAFPVRQAPRSRRDLVIDRLIEFGLTGALWVVLMLMVDLPDLDGSQWPAKILYGLPLVVLGAFEVGRRIREAVARVW